MYLFTNNQDKDYQQAIAIINKEISLAIQQINQLPKDILVKTKAFIANGSITSKHCFAVTDDRVPEPGEVFSQQIWILPMTAWGDICVKCVPEIHVVYPPELLLWWQQLEVIQTT